MVISTQSASQNGCSCYVYIMKVRLSRMQPCKIPGCTPRTDNVCDWAASRDVVLARMAKSRPETGACGLRTPQLCIVRNGSGAPGLARGASLQPTLCKEKCRYTLEALNTHAGRCAAEDECGAGYASEQRTTPVNINLKEVAVPCDRRRLLQC